MFRALADVERRFKDMQTDSADNVVLWRRWLAQTADIGRRGRQILAGLA